MAEENRIYRLLDNALKDPTFYLPENTKSREIFDTCLNLFQRDNICTVVNNQDGSLCGTYPGQLIVPLRQKTGDEETDEKCDQDGHDEATIRKNTADLIAKSKLARTRARFPFPSVLIGNKFICRSSTLSSSVEMYARQGILYLNGESTQTEPESQLQNDPTTQSSADNGDKNGESADVVHYNIATANDESILSNLKLQKKLSSSRPVKLDPNDWLLNKVRKTDIDLLHQLKVNVICDLMVENKKVKYGMYVTSSEKVDRFNRYDAFDLVSIPYPGCEFFADYSRNRYISSGLHFNWNQTFIDAELQVPGSVSEISGVDWKDYRKWDIVTLTQNYMKLILKYLISPQASGLLLHCISGWDRTPLFVSLVRLSLWADGLIHQSLDAEEMVYLTLAYDWLLFSHQFTDRIYNEEEILHFCFHFLTHMSSEEYSLLPDVENHSTKILYCNKKYESAVFDNANGSSLERKLAEAMHEDSTENRLDLSDESVNGKHHSESPFNKPSNTTVFSSEDGKHHRLVNSSTDCQNGSFGTLKGGTDAEQPNSDHSFSEVVESNGENNFTCSKDEGHSEAAFTSIPDLERSFNSVDLDTSKSIPSPRYSVPTRDANSCASSNAVSNGGASFTGSVEVVENNDTLKLNLEKRINKLKMAQDELIPAYCAVVQKHKQLLQEQSRLSAFMGSIGTMRNTLVKLVKGT